jgi:iron complex transport system permease protein
MNVFVLSFLVMIISLISIVVGQYDITVSESIYALFGVGTSSDVNIVQNVRLPRVVIGLVAGATLSLSGLFISSALKNPLADSGVLGIQAGASTFGLIIILVFPTMYFMLPLFAFFGGLLAFMITVLVSYKGGFSSLNLVLSGVAVNAFFSAIIGILTIFNVNELQGALTYLNGSLANSTSDEMVVILIYGFVLIICSFLFIPILKIIRLDEVLEKTFCKIN